MTASLATLESSARRTALAKAGLALRMGPFKVAIHSRDPDLERQLAHCYPDYRLAAPSEYCHARVHCDTRRAWMRGGARYGVVRLDDGALFSDYPAGDGLPYLEWGINWCIATRCHFLLMLHAAVVERDGCAIILPGLPGAGKSTLAAYLCHRGWRLLSDEFCLLRVGSREILPFPRLIPLKNESIDVIASCVPEAQVGPRFLGTRKGTVAHVTPPEGQAADTTPATATLIVQPRYQADVDAELTPLDPAHVFVELSKNAFNYQVQQQAGFDMVAMLAQDCPGHTLRYGDLGAAATLLDDALREQRKINRP